MKYRKNTGQRGRVVQELGIRARRRGAGRRCWLCESGKGDSRTGGWDAKATMWLRLLDGPGYSRDRPAGPRKGD